MISELVTFDGGLSTKSASHLIGRNEGVVCQNVNLERGTLYPIDSLQLIGTTTGRHIVDFNDTLISNVAYTDDRFYL